MIDSTIYTCVYIPTIEKRKSRLRIFFSFLKILSTKEESQYSFIQSSHKKKTKIKLKLHDGGSCLNKRKTKVKCSGYLSSNVIKHCRSHSLALPGPILVVYSV